MGINGSSWTLIHGDYISSYQLIHCLDMGLHKCSHKLVRQPTTYKQQIQHFTTFSTNPMGINGSSWTLIHVDYITSYQLIHCLDLGLHKCSHSKFRRRINLANQLLDTHFFSHTFFSHIIFLVTHFGSHIWSNYFFGSHFGSHISVTRSHFKNHTPIITLQITRAKSGVKTLS